MFKKLLLATVALIALNASAQTYEYDLAVTQNHKNIYCNDTLISHSVWVKNKGTEFVTNVDLYFKLANDTAYQHYTHNDTIFASDSVLLTLGVLDFEDGMNIVIDSISIINDTIVDENTANNYAQMHIHVYAPALDLPQAITFDSGLVYNWLVLDDNRQVTSGVHNWYLGVLNGDYYGPDSSREVLMIDNFNIENGTNSYFYSPNVTLNAGVKTLTFYHAYARRANAMNDKLEVVYSLDCGQTWTLLWSRVGDNLNTINPVSSVFIPKYNEWNFNQINITNLLGEAIFAFVATSGEGNFLYLDNIEIREGEITGLQNEISIYSEINIYPNPAKENINVDLIATQAQIVSYNIINVLGQSVITQDNIRLQEGKNTLSIATESLPAGIYMFEVNNNQTKTTKKFLVK